MSEAPEHIKTLIIGSGPAGYTAAIYAARADLNPVVYTGLEPGGQLTTTTEVDNFPGYPEGVDGPTMMVELQQQAERFGTDVRIGMATAVDFSKEPGGLHRVTIDDNKKVLAVSAFNCACGKQLCLGCAKLIVATAATLCTCTPSFMCSFPISLLLSNDAKIRNKRLIGYEIH